MNHTEDVFKLQRITMNSPAAEPVPDWAKAKPRLGRMWDVHCIGLGSAFALLAMSSVVSLLLSCKKKRFGRKPYVIAINALLLVLGATRAVYMFLDPYESHQKLRIWQAQLLFNISFPCLTSAFSLILYVFLSVAKLQLVSKNLQNVRFFIVVITIHFSLVICATILSIFEPSIATIVFVFCHLFFIVWGLVLSVSFIYGGLNIILAMKKTSRSLQTQKRTVASKVAKVTLVTSIFGVACSGLHVYSLFIVYRFYRDDEERPEPWMWWAFQTCFRLIEIAMACNISYCIMQPADTTSTAP